MNYSQAEELFATARDPSDGKPLKFKTRLFKDGGGVFKIWHYDSNIIRLHPNGDVEIATGWISVTTIDRIKQYTGFRVSKMVVPSYNGNSTDLDKEWVIWIQGKPVLFDALHDYILIRADGSVDMDTVKSIQIQTVSTRKGLRKLEQRFYELRRLAMNQNRLLGAESFPTGVLTGEWIQDNLTTPLSELVMPYQFYRPDGYIPDKWKLAEKLGTLVRFETKVLDYREAKCLTSSNNL